MIEVNITQEQRKEAQEMADDMGIINNSILKGQGNFTGFLGEIIVRDYYSDITKHENTYDYDLIMGDYRIDVKSKKCKFKPSINYDCSIPAYNTNQKCDAYMFVRIQNDFKKGWILGFKMKEDYFGSARLIKKGQKDGSNGLVFREDSYNLMIKELEQL